MSSSMVAASVLTKNSSFDQVLGNQGHEANREKRADHKDDSRDRGSGSQSGSGEEGQGSKTLHAVRVKGTKSTHQDGGGHGSGGGERGSGQGREFSGFAEGLTAEAGGSSKQSGKAARGAGSFDAQLNQVEELAQNAAQGGHLSKAQLEQIVAQITTSRLAIDPNQKEVLIRFREELFGGRHLQVRFGQGDKGLEIRFSGDESLLAELEAQGGELEAALKAKGQTVSHLQFV